MEKKKNKNMVKCIIHKGNYEEFLETVANSPFLSAPLCLFMKGHSLDIQKGNLVLMCS